MDNEEDKLSKSERVRIEKKWSDFFDRLTGYTPPKRPRYNAFADPKRKEVLEEVKRIREEAKQKRVEEKKEDLYQRVEEWLKEYGIEDGDIMIDDNGYYFIYDEETDNGEGYTATYPEKFYLAKEFGDEVNELSL